ncbi:TPA: hypothetical protein ACG0QJ_003754 [Proteus mirabilis]|uniref:hypothetical protein n=1 Tax=Proteus mirabilis TaxID=584 RepID=UPI002785EC68|nr:hypothetical protein [Proteus mirabilis]HDT0722597.1 hypothetical protein [Proteus mirabilis]HEJ9439244.1 hypothetical protein [Proteus mirabilis]HEJ9440119.1 hypothetical protein [Proteus mirabilis]HEJ9660948.1 hypothetical protein [Proteus mirabilis]
MKLTKINLFLFPLLFSPISHALIVPDNTTGYIGDLAPYQRSLSISLSDPSNYGGTVGVNNIANFCGSNKEGWKSYLFPFPGSNSGEYGLKLYNKNASDEENKQNYLIAAINGTVSITFVYYQNGTYDTVNIRLVRGKEVSRQGNYSDSFTIPVPMCWFGSVHRISSATLNISSYSVYAVGHVKPGIYDFVAPIYFTGAQTSSSRPVSKVPFSFGNGPIHVLKTCQVAPLDSTNIQFLSQLAGKFNSPKLLDKQIANMTISCPNSGNLYVSLKPYGELVTSSKTGMKMTPVTPLKQTESAPYITVSNGEKSITDSACRKNDSTALPFYDGQSFGAYQSGSIVKSLSFNLCAEGTIPANKYTGSIDVSFLIE